MAGIVEDARVALDEGLPSVAIAKLGAAEVKLDRDASSLLAEAYWQVGEAGRSSEILRGMKDTKPLSNAEMFLLGQCELAMGNIEEAERVFAGVEGAMGKLGQARALAAQGREDEALRLLERVNTARSILDRAAVLMRRGDVAAVRKLLAEESVKFSDAEQVERDYLLASGLFADGDAEGAAQVLDKLDGLGLPAGLAADVVLVRAKVLIALGRMEDAALALESFIEGMSAYSGLRGIFAALDEVYAAQKSPAQTALRRWSAAGQMPRAALAQYYLGRNEVRLGRPERAQAAFFSFIERMPGDPLADLARCGIATILINQNKASEALLVLGDGHSWRVSFSRGLALAALGRYGEAADSFSEVVEKGGGESLKQILDLARHNAVLCAILAGRDVPTPDDESLALVRGLVLAERGDAQAQRVLAEVAERFQGSAGAAQLALAEMGYAQGDTAAARKSLEKIPAGDAAVEQGDALAVFLMDDGGGDGAERTARAAIEYLKKNPESPQRAEVTMKLAEILFRRGDFVGAKERFDEVAADRLGSSLADKARFLSAIAGMRTMNEETIQASIDGLDALARSGGALAGRARLAQGLAYNAQRKTAEALAAFDAIIAGRSEDAVFYAALLKKGDTIFSAGTSESTRKAIEIWKLAIGQEIPVQWKNQALCKIGVAAESLDDTTAALVAYSDALEGGLSASGEVEYFWSGKAGFDAARLLEKLNRSAEAEVIYTKIATSGGPRAKEAAARLQK